MKLGARILNNTVDANHFVYADQVEMYQSDPVTVTLQLLDITLDTDKDPPGRRYVPAISATLQININPINDAQKISRSASQPFAGDASIWQFQLLATDILTGTQDIQIQLTEGMMVRTGIIKYGLAVTPLNQSYQGI